MTKRNVPELIFNVGSCVIVEPEKLRQSIADLKTFLKLAPEHHIEICAANYLIGCNWALLPGFVVFRFPFVNFKRLQSGNTSKVLEIGTSCREAENKEMETLC